MMSWLWISRAELARVSLTRVAMRLTWHSLKLLHRCQDVPGKLQCWLLLLSNFHVQP